MIGQVHKLCNIRWHFVWQFFFLFISLTFKCVIFNDAVSCWYYIVLVIDECAWSTSGMMLTGENRSSIWIKICPIPSLPIANPTWTGLGLNSGFCGERPVTCHQNYVMAHTKLVWCNDAVSGFVVCKILFVCFSTTWSYFNSREAAGLIALG